MQAHFEAPLSGWSWLVLEFDGQDTLFGLVRGFETELGYFSLSELESITNSCSDPTRSVVRDDTWVPKPLSQILKR